ncbi:dol-P-Glc:Glc(2)Man(9)GlcNAc(2)-PP-Dol alpha-1,2-glucosyltransferase isoform X2 [Aristolochia californica]|uniref:dol-P-Glc:Glc(2)Man(9)GlcNAc(2)-PP-Dol alpha-1,2-glucosyltransferase isoform X2 n=1 Tax=Aristolochia californica TaxID=171875 RepID=UPI0035E343FD
MGRLAVALVVSLWVIPISIMVNHVIPDPYMDEIFHIPQAQQFCNGNFRSWDPMITTPPVLRSTNGVLAVLCSILLYDIILHLRPSIGERGATLYTIVLTLYPLHWFFTFLYYTDVASLAVILAMYLACLKRHYWLSALLGGLAISIRQTNVIWMLFVAGTGAIDYLVGEYHKKFNDHIMITKSEGLADENYRPVSANLKRRKMGSSVRATDISISKASVCSSRGSSNFSSGMLKEIQEIFFALWCLKWNFFVLFTPYLLIFSTFVSFVIWNGSIVLGAKEAHTVSPHFAQIFYFGLASTAAMGPIHFNLHQAAALFKSLRMSKLVGFFVVCMALTAGLISVHFFSIEHPYLLADNRHYPFYIWRKVIKAHWLMKYLLVPLYVYSWSSIFHILGKFQRKTWVLLFFLACAAVLIPAPLIEFRYYTIPFFFIILHSPVGKYKHWFLIAVLYLIVNFFTMAMFLYRPFHWDHEPGTQRFIW